jgi:hypothetical protein
MMRALCSRASSISIVTFLHRDAKGVETRAPRRPHTRNQRTC